MTRTVKITATFDDLKGFYGSDAQLLVGAEMVVTSEGKGWYVVLLKVLRYILRKVNMSKLAIVKATVAELLADGINQPDMVGATVEVLGNPWVGDELIEFKGQRWVIKENYLELH